MRKAYRALPLLVLGALLGGVCHAAPQRYSLEDFSKLAMEASPSLGEQKAQVEYAHARQDFADSKRWASGKIQSIIAPVPDASGDSLSGTTDWGSWGPLWANSIEIWQPIYTFGAISSGREAARAGLEAEKLLLVSEGWKLRKEVAQFYFAYQLAFELQDLAQGVLDKLESAQKKLRKTKGKVSGALKLRMAAAEIQARLSEAKQGKEKARSAMAWKIGRYMSPDKIYWDQSNLKALEIELGNLESYQNLAKAHRADWKALEQETIAQKELADVEWGKSFPKIVLYGKGTYNVASGRDNRSSGPFAYDPSNSKSGLVGLGLQMDLDFIEAGARRGQSRAEFYKAQAKKTNYQQGILLEVEKNYRDLVYLKEALKIRGDLSKALGKRYQDAMIAYGLGNLSGNALFERLSQYGVARKDFLESQYKFNMAIVELERSVGQKLAQKSSSN